jgi:hypothetical protein
MFSSLFSVMYESWLTGSLNPFTILLVITMTLVSEEAISGGDEEPVEELAEEPEVAPLPLPGLLRG